MCWWWWEAGKAAGPTGSRQTWPASGQGDWLCAPYLEVGWGKLRRRTSTSRCSSYNTSLTDRSIGLHGVDADEYSPKQRDTVAPEFASVAFRMRKTGAIPSELALSLSLHRAAPAGPFGDSCGAQYNNEVYSLYQKRPESATCAVLPHETSHMAAFNTAIVLQIALPPNKLHLNLLHRAERFWRSCWFLS